MLGLLGALDPHKHKVRKGRGVLNTMGMPISKPMDKSSKTAGGNQKYEDKGLFLSLWCVL